MRSIPTFLLSDRTAPPAPVPTGATVRMPFLEKGVRRLSGLVSGAYADWELSRRDGLLQRLDPRAKVLFLITLLVVISLKRQVVPQLGIAAFLFVLVLLSRLDAARMYLRVGSLALVFGGLVALPSALNVFSPGEVVVPVARFAGPVELGFGSIPAVLGFTRPGLLSVATLFLRVANSVAASLLVLHTTAFTELVKALRILRIPDSMVLVVSLSYRYLFLFARTAEEMHRAKRSRLLGAVQNREARGWAAGRMALLVRRAQARCEAIHRAMVARGFSGDVRLYPLKRMGRRDLAATALLLAAVGFFLWFGG